MTTSYTEKYRPQYHFSPPSAWLNDPNGMVYYEGEFHLFYQHHPHSSVWGPMHWGHAVSTNLVHWEPHPIAMHPDHNGYIFSGSAVVDWNDTSGFFGGNSGLVAIFTQHQDLGGEKFVQRQSIAYSKDKGRTWTKYEGNPVLEEERFVDFRDPKVFWDALRNRWCMVLSAGDSVLFYYSSNLREWTFGSEFGTHDGSHDGVWECPDLFELPVDGDEGRRKWVLIVSIGANPELPEGSRTQYFIGSFDGERFINDHPADQVLWLDYGRDNYAGVTWSDVPENDGRRLFIGWMSNWHYANQTPTEVWRSAMTLPRALELRSDKRGRARIHQEPVQELIALREPVVSFQDVIVQPDDNPLQGMSEDRFEIEAEFELLDAEEFGFIVRAGNEESTVVGYDVAKRQVFIDRYKSGVVAFHEYFACRHEAALEPRAGKIKLRLFVDASSIEVFGGEGGLAMTDLIFPKPTSTGMSVYSRQGSVLMVSLQLFRLSSIWRAQG